MSVEFYRESLGKFDSRTLNRTNSNRWTGRIIGCLVLIPLYFFVGLSFHLDDFCNLCDSLVCYVIDS